MMRFWTVQLVALMIVAVKATASESADNEFEPLFQRISPAMVMLYTDENTSVPIGAGVVISSAGHILTLERKELVDVASSHRSLVAVFPNGQKALASMLGWSEDWNIALAKLDGGREWPHVKMNCTTPHVGDRCIALELTKQRRSLDFTPVMRVGQVKTSVAHLWFEVTCQLDDWSPVFSEEGRLLGLTSVLKAGVTSFQTPSEVLLDNWSLFANRKNVDQERLGGPRQLGSRCRTLPMITQHPPSVVIEATVRIRPEAKPGESGQVVRHGWSGVIISRDGLIATCAHHGRLPGERVTVYLADGKTACGQILGMNRVSDVGLVQLASGGPWPCTQVGSSRELAAGTKCWLAGYPADRVDRHPLVRQSTVVDEGRPWSCMLYTDAAVEIHGGESGGGVFDSCGRLIGILEGQNLQSAARYRRIEVLKKQLPVLNVTKTAETISDLKQE